MPSNGLTNLDTDVARHEQLCAEAALAPRLPAAGRGVKSEAVEIADPRSKLMNADTDTKSTIAVLGTGRMGAPIARNLLAAGFPVRAWNRTVEKARPLEDAGAVVVKTPADAATTADVLVTMLADGPATERAVTGDAGAFAGLQRDAIWVQMGTIGLDWTMRLAAQAGEHGVAFIDAPGGRRRRVGGRAGTSFTEDGKGEPLTVRGALDVRGRERRRSVVTGLYPGGRIRVDSAKSSGAPRL